MKTYDFDCVILTHGNKGAPHLDVLKVNNPGLEVSVVQGKSDWKNADRNIRGDSFSKARRLYLEYDVLVKCDLLEIFPNTGVGMEGAVLSQSRTDADPVCQFLIHQMPEVFRPTAKVMAPLSVVMLSKEAIEDINHNRYDDIFMKSIPCEIRLSTVASHAGHSVVRNPFMFDVRRRPFPIENRKGIFHPVK